LTPTIRPFAFSSSRSVSLSNQSTRSDSPAISTPAISTSAISTSAGQSKGNNKPPPPPLTNYELEIMARLEINTNVTRVGPDPSHVRDYYKRFVINLEAQETIKEGWDAPPRCPTQDDVITLFISKSTWYGTWFKAFENVEDHLDMKAWLEGDDTVKVWANPKAKHRMSHVKHWCANKTKELEKKKRSGGGGKSSSSKKSTKATS